MGKIPFIMILYMIEVFIVGFIVVFLMQSAGIIQREIIPLDILLFIQSFFDTKKNKDIINNHQIDQKKE